LAFTSGERESDSEDGGEAAHAGIVEPVLGFLTEDPRRL
jgi:hypothetical protein